MPAWPTRLGRSDLTTVTFATNEVIHECEFECVPSTLTRSHTDTQTHENVQHAKALVVRAEESQTPRT